MKVPAVISDSILSRTFSSFLRLAGLSVSRVCSRQRAPSNRNSKNSNPLSTRLRMLGMEHAPICHRDARHAQRPGHGFGNHIALNDVPVVKDFAFPKRAEVVHSFQ